MAIAFHVGTAHLLGAVALERDRLVVELAEVHGCGEGALPALWNLGTRCAIMKELDSFEWIVYATDCARPSPKLRRVLERSGFETEDVPGKGRAFRFLQAIAGTAIEPAEPN